MTGITKTACGRLIAASLVWTVVSICWILWNSCLFQGFFNGNEIYAYSKVPLAAGFGGAGRSLLFFQPIDLNRATYEDLLLIPMIGERRASRIVCFRQNMGFILSIDELSALNGPFSPGLLATVRPFLSVGGTHE